MDCLTQRKEELFKDEGQDAKREIGKLSPTVSTEWSKGNRRCTGAGAVRRDLDLVVGQSEMVMEEQLSSTEEARWAQRE